MLSAVIVGAGRSGSHLMMRPLIKLKSEIKISAICDTNVELREKVAKQNGVSRTFDSLKSALLSIDVDVVFISTPHSSHYELAKEALLHDCHVVVEKPFTNTYAQAEELIELANVRNLLITCVHNHKFYNGMRTGREYVKSERLGDINSVYCTWMSSQTNRMVKDKQHWVHKEFGGIFKEVIPHAIYNTVALFGNLVFDDITFDQREPNLTHLRCRGAHIRLRNAQGIPIIINVSFDGEYENGPKPKPTWFVQGSKDTLLISYNQANFSIHTNKDKIILGLGAVVSKLKSYMINEEKLGPHAFVINDFVAYINKKAVDLPVTKDEILNTMFLTEQICQEIEAYG